MLEAYTDGLGGILRDGGAVMPVLIGLAVVLWYALTVRTLTLRAWLVDDARARVAAADGDRELGRLAVVPVDEELGRGRATIASLVVAAPLLGLLGTVSGMIETFDSLGQAALFRASGGIAGGIAEALLTTQVGLCIAVPGLVLGRLLDRREAALRAQVEATWAS